LNNLRLNLNLSLDLYSGDGTLLAVAADEVFDCLDHQLIAA
jgi:hypothetical protein